MSNVALLPFGIFFACAVLQFWFQKKIRDTLVDRHPDALLAVERSSIFPGRGIWKFAQHRKDKALGDPELSRHVRNLNLLMFVAIGAWLALAACIFLLPMRAPGLPVSTANGSYASDCCATLSLQDGRMRFGRQQVRYVVERDNQGPYVLTAFYVGPSPGGLAVDRTQYPLKMRLDDAVHPSRIELTDRIDGRVFAFRRLGDN